MSLQTAQLGFPVMIQLAKQVLLAIYKRVEAQAWQIRVFCWLREHEVQYWIELEHGWHKVELSKK
jgi:hypothetical protein